MKQIDITTFEMQALFPRFRGRDDTITVRFDMYESDHFHKEVTYGPVEIRRLIVAWR